MPKSLNGESSAGQIISLGVRVEQLVKSPLGVIGLCLVLSVAVFGYASGANSLDASDRHLLLLGASVFALISFAAFFYMSIQHPGKLLNPHSFRTDKAYLEAIGAKAAVPVSAPPELWPNPNIWVGESLPGGEITTTTVMSLFQALREIPQEWVYLLVDIEAGRR